MLMHYQYLIHIIYFWQLFRTNPFVDEGGRTSSLLQFIIIPNTFIVLQRIQRSDSKY